MALKSGVSLVTFLTWGILLLANGAQATPTLLPLGDTIVDPSFTSALSGGRLATKRSLVRFPDGSVAALMAPALVPGRFNYDSSTFSLQKTRADGSLDPLFVPQFDFSSVYYRRDALASTSLYLSINDAGLLTLRYEDKGLNPRSVSFNPDGTQAPSPASALAGSVSNNHVTLVDGNDLEVTFTVEGSLLKVSYIVTNGAGDVLRTTTQDLAIDGSADNFNAYSVSFLPQSSGKVVVVFHWGGSSFFGPGKTVMIRLLADGTVDPSVEPTSVLGSIDVSRDPNSDLIRVVRSYTFGIHVRTTTVSYFRLLPSLEPDPTFGGLSFTESFSALPQAVEYQPTGNSFFDGFLEIDKYFGETPASFGSFTVTKYDTDAQPVQNFKLSEVAVDQLTPSDLEDFITVTPLEDGRFFITGSFTSIQGVHSPHAAYLYPAVHDVGTRLSNLSVRASASTDERNLVLGFTLAGTGSRPALLRGAGPSLSPFGITQFATDPNATLYLNASPLAFNDNWGDDTELRALAASSGAFPFQDGSGDAALAATLGAGSYSLVVRPANGAEGIALGEFYDSGAAPAAFADARVSNLSVRAFAGSGEQTLIAGFTLSGSNSKRVLLRAIGPGLAGFGITSPLADPLLTVYRGKEKLMDNDNWSGENAEADLFTVLGAFPLANGSKDSALQLTLAPGNYTIHVSSVEASSGLALLEVYEIQ